MDVTVATIVYPAIQVQPAVLIDRPYIVSTLMNQRWLFRYNQLQRYVADHGHLPSVTDGTAFGNWVKRQRYVPRSEAKRYLLEQVPGWTKRKTNFYTWRIGYCELVKFVDDHGFIPQGSSRLAVWCRQQKFRPRMERRQELLKRVPGWEAFISRRVDVGNLKVIA